MENAWDYGQGTAPFLTFTDNSQQYACTDFFGGYYGAYSDCTTVDTYENKDRQIEKSKTFIQPLFYSTPSNGISNINQIQH